MIQYGQSEDIEFMQINNIANYDSLFNPNNGVVAAVFVRSDKMYDSYTR